MNILLELAAISTLTAAAPPTPEPINDPATWITSDDYPAAALHQNSTGVVTFEAGVDAFGAVERCRVVGSSGSLLLDGLTCGLVTARAKFRPATDEAGHAVSSIFTQRVRWEIPHTKLEADRNLQPYSFTMRFDLTPEGAVRDCQVLTHSGAAGEAANACRRFQEGVRIAPFRNAAGQLVSKTIVVRSELEVRDP